MSQEIHIDSSLNKAQKYIQLIPQIEALVEGEPNFIANVANIISVLKYEMGFYWVGCYFIDENELVLGPFQGPVACTRIRYGKGVCGKAWEKKEVILVPDVNAFEGHIACSSETNSEIVLPIINRGEVIGVFDVDSLTLDDFDEIDKLNLEKISRLIGTLYV